MIKPETLSAVGSTVLLACPFCGGKANFVNTKDGGVCIECDHYPCMASSRVIYPDKTDPMPLLAEAWNSRDGDLATIGAKWRQNSSLEEWFPMTAEELDRLRVQLAGCAVAALDGSKSQEAKPHSYGWSPSYADVLKLRRSYDRLLRSLLETKAHWLTMAADKKAQSGQDAASDTLEACAYALGAALQANAELNHGGDK